VARTYQAGVAQLGVVLPPGSTVASWTLRRLAPFDDVPDVGATLIESGDAVSFVAFAAPGGATWRPGVYALSVGWTDGEGAHDETWHVELRPGPLSVEPFLLSATRAWAAYAGLTGVLLGAAVPFDPTTLTPGIGLVGIVPQTGTLYAGLSGSNLVGCGATAVHGRPEVIGIVGPVGAASKPVTARILYPIAAEGQLEVLTAAGSVPGLTLVAPLVTAEFGGPAAYGFRAGTSFDAPGYTICIGLVSGG
jgi:hypothetical protein